MGLSSDSIKVLLPPEENFTPTDLIEHVAGVMYTEEARAIRNSIEELPEMLRIIIWIIDFDTELTMNGILGFLENSSGRYLSETVAALQLIGATKDAALLKEIEKQVEKINVETKIELNPYQVTSFEDRHSINEEALKKIEELADRLYLNSDDRNVFGYLVTYLSDHWNLRKDLGS